MFRRRCFRILITLAVFCVIFNKFFQPVQFIFVHQNVNTTCILPDLDPFDKSVMKFVHHPKPIECDPTPSMVYVDADGKLKINKTVTDRLGENSLECLYRTVQRNGENDVTFSKEVKFLHPVYVPADLINVQCSTNNKAIFDTILFNIDNETVLKNKRLETESNEKLSLYIFGYDSVSRLAAERKMPKTMGFLKNQLKGNVLKGYTMIGGNTYPNLIAVLTGHTAYSRELPSLDVKTEYTDKYPFIWKEFSRNGGVTMYSEDFPEISIFDNNMKGFDQPPGDHYLRPYYIAQKKVSPVQTNIEMFKVLMFLENNKIKLGKYSPLCYKDRPKHVLHMEHYKKFVTTYKNYYKFAFSWLTEISHEFMNFLELVDDDNVDFLKTLQDGGHLEKAVLVFMSDHGPRNDEIRNSAVGRIEERMPLLTIVIPEHIKQKYPHLAINLKDNEKRLTSPYDIHETFMDIVNSNFKEQEEINRRPYPRGISLFRRIPKDRTCADASIAEHFCACYTVQNVTVHSDTVQNIAQYAVKTINGKLSNVVGRCSRLSLHKILDAQKIGSGLQHRAEFDRTSILNLFYEPESHVEQRYLILFQTLPGMALFEATISFTDINNIDSFKLLGDVSRTNKYKNQSHCVNTQKLKPICFCKKQI